MIDKIKAIIFDLDGTMVDNMMVHHHAWQEILKDLGLDLQIDEVMAKVHGINEEILERLFGDRLSPSERSRISQEKEANYRKKYLTKLKLVDGLSEFIDLCSAHGIKLAVATAAPKENLDFVLDNLKIRNNFQVTLHAGDVIQGKPDPEVYKKALTGLGISPSECLVFEDSPTGAEAA